MKTRLISKLNKELLIIELPKGAKMLPPEIINGNTYISYSPALFAPPTNLELLANGKWKILGKTDEIKEEDVVDLCDRIGINNPLADCDFFAHYGNDETMFETAIESFHSALESEIYWQNPLGTEPNHIDYKFEKHKGEYHFKSESHKSRYGNAYEKWQQAEFDTFDKKRTLIFVKN